MFNTSVSRIFSLAFFAGLLLTFTACDKTPIVPIDNNNTIQTNQKMFDMDVFESNIEEGLGVQWAGYGYVINQNGQAARTGAFGNRQYGNDGSTDFEITNPIYAASLNKTIAAVAMMRILEEKGDAQMWLNGNVYQFLPNVWNFGENTTNIKFRDLLTHSAGLPDGIATDVTSLRSMIATGTSDDKSYTYNNANFALIRILVAMMSGNADIANLGDDEALEAATIAGYRRYVETNILDPLDIDVDTKPFGASPAHYYNWSDLDNGWEIGNRSSTIGSGGYYISPLHMAKFLAYLNHTEDIISADTRDLLYDNFLGLGDGSEPSTIQEGDYGTYYYKGGSLTCGNGCNNKGVRNILAVFPHNGVELVIMANSRGGAMDNSGALRQMVRDAYDDAWITP